MNSSSAGLILVAVCAIAAGATGAQAGSRVARLETRLHAEPGTSGAASGALQSRGRYKKQGRACVWDASDTGPSQCTPRSEGRFRRDGAACVWDAAARGADQCRPKTGRFKKDGDKCVWSATDSGPNQCNPREPR